MSAGTRIPLAVAEAAATYLLVCWGLDGGDATIVGSVRRRKLDVGDLEICVPWSPPECDELYKAIHASANQQDGLFEGPSDTPPLTIVKGVKPGFKAARVIAHVRHNDCPLDIPVDIFRFMPGARGWSILMRTGPAEFGQWFLGRWKRHWGTTQDQLASINGCLVDQYGKRVQIDDEVGCFAKINIGYVQPEQRESFMAHMRSG